MTARWPPGTTPGLPPRRPPAHSVRSLESALSYPCDAWVMTSAMTTRNNAERVAGVFAAARICPGARCSVAQRALSYSCARVVS